MSSLACITHEAILLVKTFSSTLLVFQEKQFTSDHPCNPLYNIKVAEEFVFYSLLPLAKKKI